MVEDGRLPREVLDVRIEIADPKNPEHGDFACNFAMTASKVAGKNPRELAQMLVEELPLTLKSPLPSQIGEGTSEVFDSIEIAGPGFINLTLNPVFVASFVGQVNSLAEGELAKQSPVSTPQKINVEFVSVNPNGPITIGSGRGAAYGSTLCNVLEAAGNTVHREYYINDGVNSEQMRLFAESVRALIKGEPVPENGYKGDYVQDVARYLSSIRARLDGLGGVDFSGTASSVVLSGVSSDNSAVHKICKEHATAQGFALGEYLIGANVQVLQKLSEEIMIGVQREALSAFDVNYNTWFSEQWLHDEGIVAAEIEALHAKGIADTELVRTKLKLAKGGKLEDVVVESQTAEVNEDGEVEEVEEVEGVADVEEMEEIDEIAYSTNGETLWLRSTKLGDDMDRVLRRKDGRLTYIASDVAYHKNKFKRPTAGADKLITILGPDHHGYIGRLTAVVAAMLMQPTEPGAPCEDPLDAKLYRDVNEKAECERALAEAKKRLEVQIYQLVRFMKDGKPAPMRKRDGNIYALIDLMREIGEKLRPQGSEAEKLKAGKDVARFFYLMRSHDTTFDFDLDLAEKQSDENPVFYVQYAHARICSILDKAEGTALTSEGDLTLLTHPKEKALIKRVVDLPNEVARAAEDYGVHRLATYAIELARAFHGFYGDCKVISEDAALTAARLDLCRATKRALQETLSLLGVSAPTKM